MGISLAESLSPPVAEVEVVVLVVVLAGPPFSDVVDVVVVVLRL